MSSGDAVILESVCSVVTAGMRYLKDMPDFFCLQVKPFSMYPVLSVQQR